MGESYVVNVFYVRYVISVKVILKQRIVKARILKVRILKVSKL